MDANTKKYLKYAAIGALGFAVVAVIIARTSAGKKAADKIVLNYDKLTKPQQAAA